MRNTETEQESKKVREYSDRSRMLKDMLRKVSNNMIRYNTPLNTNKRHIVPVHHTDGEQGILVVKPWFDDIPTPDNNIIKVKSPAVVGDSYNRSAVETETEKAVLFNVLVDYNDKRNKMEKQWIPKSAIIYCGIVKSKN